MLEPTQKGTASYSVALTRFYHHWQIGNVQNSFKSHIQIPFQLCRQWQCCIHCWHFKNIILKLTLGIYVKYRKDKCPNCNFLSAHPGLCLRVKEPKMPLSGRAQLAPRGTAGWLGVVWIPSVSLAPLCSEQPAQPYTAALRPLQPSTTRKRFLLLLQTPS